MSSKDLIDIFLTLSTVFISLVALFQSNKSIKLTEQSIKEANRPYLTIYVETIDTIYFSKHLTLKNFGNTSAKILSLSCKGLDQNIKRKIDFSSLINGSIAPGQKFTTAIDDNLNRTLCFSISYQELDGTIHNEKMTVKTNMSETLTWTTKNLSSDSSEATAIKKATHALIKAFK